MSGRARLTLAVSARIVLGAALAAAGFVKAAAPLEEFAAAIEGYRALPHGLALPAAHAVAWTELLIGVFLAAGHRTRAAAAAAGALMAGFTALQLVTAARRLTPGDCGCFGSLLHLSPLQAAALDAVFFALAVAAYRRGGDAFALDRALGIEAEKDGGSS